MANRRAAAKKAAKTRRLRAAGKKAARTRTLRAAGKKAVLTKKRRAAARKAATTRKRKGETVKVPSPATSVSLHNSGVAEVERHLLDPQIVRAEPITAMTEGQDAERRMPDAKQYVEGLTLIEGRMSRVQRELLLAQWAFPGHVASATQLARATGLSGYRAIICTMDDWESSFDRRWIFRR